MNDDGKKADARVREVVTNSRMKSFRACRRLHHYRYDLLRRPIKVPGALSIGTLYHAGLEGWWRWFLAVDRAARHGDPTMLPGEQARDAAMAALAAGALEAMESDEVDSFKIAGAQRMMAAYDARWRDEVASEWEVLGVEVPFACRLVNPDTERASQLYALAGKIDAVAKRRRTERVWFFEHKSAGESIAPDARYWLKLRADWQVSTYYSGLDQLGIDVEGCVYDVIKKPSLEPAKATPEDVRKYTVGKACKECGGSNPKGAPPIRGTGLDRAASSGTCESCRGSGWKDEPKLYANQRAEDETVEAYADRVSMAAATDPDLHLRRAEVVRLDAELVEHRFDAWQTVRAIHETKLAGHYSRNPDSCFLFGRPCEFHDVCWAGADINDPNMFRAARSANEELGDDFDVSVEALLRRLS